MIHFHHKTTFQALPSSIVLTHIGTEEISFTRTIGRYTAHSCQNYSLNINFTVQYYTQFISVHEQVLVYSEYKLFLRDTGTPV